MITIDVQELVDAALIGHYLTTHGAVYVPRALQRDTRSQFSDLVRRVSGEPLPYMERSTPRTALGENIYTSTEYPSHTAIPFHNENSYSHQPPRRLHFCCEKPATEGGETLLADGRGVLKRLDPSVASKFSELGWRYVRNLSPRLGLSWEQSFGTKDRARATELAHVTGAKVEWLGPDWMRVSATRRAVWKHPQTGDRSWFNHVLLFHPTSLAVEVRAYLEKTGGPEVFPTNATYGDGTPIDDDTMSHIRECFNAETISIRWGKGDVVLVDNHLMAHGRAVFTGERTILTALTN